MLKSVFEVTQDRLRARGIAVDGPAYLLVLAAAALVLGVLAAGSWKLGWLPDPRVPVAALGLAAIGIVLLVVTALTWPAAALIIDRAARQITLDKGRVTGQRLPLEKVRFEITEVKRWTHLRPGGSWAFIARIPGEPDLQLYLSVKVDNVKLLWQELGEWLAAGAR